MRRIFRLHLLLALGLSLSGPLMAQNADSDLAPVPNSEAAYGTTPAQPAAPATEAPAAPAAPDAMAVAPAATDANATAAAPAASGDPTRYDQKSVLQAATSFFGKGAEGVGGIIERIFADLGEPNGYIAGTEASGALLVGLRYGSGTLYHKVEGNSTVHWTGPSLGVDIGGDASKVFTLVYNLNDTEDLYRRYPAVEGKVYIVGGFTANYHQRAKVILVPIKLGVGWRLGANVGYLKYSKKPRYLPF